LYVISIDTEIRQLNQITCTTISTPGKSGFHEIASFLLLGGLYSPTLPVVSKAGRRSKPRGSLRRCIRIPTARHCPCHRYHTTNCVLCQHFDENYFSILALHSTPAPFSS